MLCFSCILAQQETNCGPKRGNVDPIRTPRGPFRFPAVTDRRGPTRVATQACRDRRRQVPVPPRRRRRHRATQPQRPAPRRPAVPPSRSAIAWRRTWPGGWRPAPCAQTARHISRLHQVPPSISYTMLLFNH